MPPASAGPPEAYARAARTLRAWLADGTLIRDPRPALYVYHQQFLHEGRKVTRRMFFTRLRLEPFGAGRVFPHEQTFGGPKEDRLMLTRATRCNLSPVFGLYPDPENQVSELLHPGDRPPTCRGRLDEVESLLWVVDDAPTIDRAAEVMAGRAIFIADGHHRYGTALMYRDELARQAGPLPANHPANYVLVVCCAMEDDGLIILPTHRLLLGLDASRAVAALRSAQAVRITPAGVDIASPVPPGSYRVYNGTTRAAWSLRVDGPSVMKPLAPDKSDAWRRLDVAILHRYLIDEVLRPHVPAGKELETRYVKDVGAGRSQADEMGGLLFEMAPTSMTDLQRVCRAGELMPQKSTFFYPKLATGLVINPLTD
jgi:uncharacterized protein (DUF1015 family)